MATFQTEEELKIIFVSSCIESAARAVGCPASQMYPSYVEQDWQNSDEAIRETGNLSIASLGRLLYLERLRTYARPGD